MPRRNTFKGPVCGTENCTATRYVEDEEGVSCVRGHLHPELQQAGAEDDSFVQATSQTRARRERVEREKVHVLLTGAKGFEHYLLCYQLILRKQSWWLVNDKKLPKELEVIIRDLWSLRLQKFDSRLELDEEEAGAGSQHQFHSTADESEHRDSTKVSKHRKLSENPTLMETVALCYLGILLLRLPISPADFQRWAESGSLPYNRAFASIPEDMRRALPAPYHVALEPVTVLRPGDIQLSVLYHSMTYQREYQMELPPVNVSLLLYRYIKELALPIDVYPCVQRLARAINYTFTYPPPTSQARLFLIPDVQILSLIIFAAKLLYPISESRIYPTTSTEPASKSLNWQTWLSAKRTHDQKFSHAGRLSYKDAHTAKEADVFEWNDAQMDDYLAYYQRTWAESEPPANDSFRKAMFDMFPIGTDEPLHPVPEGLDEDLMPNRDALEASQRERVRAVQSGLKPRKVVSEKKAGKRAEKDEPTPRPGSIYMQYKRVEDLDGPNSGDGAMRALYEQASEMVSLPLDTVVHAVVMTEAAFKKWTENEEKKEKLELRRQKEQVKRDGDDTDMQDA